MKNYLLKACKKCGGDLARDWGDWICLQCGAYCYVGLYAPDTRPGHRPAAAANPPQQPALPAAGLPRPGGETRPAGTERAAAMVGVSRPGGETRPAGTERAAARVGVSRPGGETRPAGTERAAAAIEVSRPGGETRPAGTERAAAMVGVTWPDSPACWAVTR